jgi:hypothetical protein
VEAAADGNGVATVLLSAAPLAAADAAAEPLPLGDGVAEASAGDGVAVNGDGDTVAEASGDGASDPALGLAGAGLVAAGLFVADGRGELGSLGAAALGEGLSAVDGASEGAALAAAAGDGAGSEADGDGSAAESLAAAVHDALGTGIVVADSLGAAMAGEGSTEGWVVAAAVALGVLLPPALLPPEGVLPPPPPAAPAGVVAEKYA